MRTRAVGGTGRSQLRALPPLVVAVALAVVFFLVYRVQLDLDLRGGRTEAWLADVVQMREILYGDDPRGTTAYVVAGSNALFGIDSVILGEAIGRPVRNYALHAGLHVDLLFAQVIDRVAPGDVVIAPLEWAPLNRPLGDAFDADNYLAFLHRFVDLSLPQAFHLWTSLGAARLYNGLATYLQTPAEERYRLPLTDEALLEAWRERPLPPEEVYSFRALTPAGDINIERPLTAATWREASAGLTIPVAEGIGDAGVATLLRWQRAFERRGARLVIVAPIMLEDASGQLTDREYWRRVELLRERLAAVGLALSCDPVEATYSSIHRFNTPFHANGEGARVRSAELGACLQRGFMGEDIAAVAIDPDVAAERVRLRFAAQEASFGIGTMPFQLRLRGLAALRDALAAYHTANGAYPRSEGYDGVASIWGAATAEYVGGLAPGYIPALPIDPAGQATSPIEPQFIYWSDGNDYKILSISVRDDCAVVFANWPDMIDPVRIENGDPMNCGAYGYWSFGAADR